jgi:glucokinase
MQNFSSSSLPASGDDAFDGPRLLADIGGTNARFALEIAPQEFAAVAVLPCKDYASLELAIMAYLADAAAQQASRGSVRHAAVAIANPVDGDSVRMTNHHWEFSIQQLRVNLGFETFLVVNDFSALAMALPYLKDEDKLQVGGGAARSDSAIGLIGAGTGLGVSGLVPTNGQWTPLHSEGGHVTFSPADEREICILRFAWRHFSHVSAERLLSGDGLEMIYQALLDMKHQPVIALDAPTISYKAMHGECKVCAEAVDCFCAMLGTMAGNVGVTLGAAGGIYIGGGIVPRLGQRFIDSPFRARFEQKGRFSSYLAQIPVYVITAQYPAFLGVSAMLAAELAQNT